MDSIVDSNANLPYDSIGEVFRHLVLFFCKVYPSEEELYVDEEWEEKLIRLKEWMNWRQCSKKLKEIADRIFIKEIGIHCESIQKLEAIPHLITRFEFKFFYFKKEEDMERPAKEIVSIIERKELTVLKEICLDMFESGPPSKHEMITALSHPHLVMFHSLSLYFSQFQPENAKDLAVLLNGNTLTSLDLSLTMDGEGPIEDLAYALKKNKSLNQFSISFQQIPTEFISCVLSIPSLKSLCISDELFDDEMPLTILEGMRRGVNKIEFLDLSNNFIKDGNSIADLLKESKTLTELDLYNCSIGDKSGMMILEALRFNETLTRLHLSENYFEEKVLKQIEEMMIRNTKLEIIC